MKLLRLNVNDDYNYGMDGADIADQICGSVIVNGGIQYFGGAFKCCW